MPTREEVNELVARVSQRVVELSTDILENGLTDEKRQAAMDLVNTRYPILEVQGPWSDEALSSERSQPPELSDEVRDGIREFCDLSKDLMDRFHELGYDPYESYLQRRPPPRLSDEAQRILPSRRRATCEPTTRDSAADLAPEELAKGSNAKKRAQTIEEANDNTQTTSPVNDPENDPSLIEAFASQHKLLTEAAQQRIQDEERDEWPLQFYIDDVEVMRLWEATHNCVDKLKSIVEREESQFDMPEESDIDWPEDDEAPYDEDHTYEEPLESIADWDYDSKCASYIRHEAEVKLAEKMHMSVKVPNSGTALPRVRNLFNNRFGVQDGEEREETNIQSAPILHFRWERIAARFQQSAQIEKAKGVALSDEADTDMMDFGKKQQKSSDEMPEESAGPDLESDCIPRSSRFEDMCLRALQKELKRLRKTIKRHGNGKAKEELEAIFKGEGIWDDEKDVKNVDLRMASLDAVIRVQDVLIRHVPNFTFVDGKRRA